MLGINDVTGQIVDSAYHIHYKLGPGLYESVYETILARDLAARGLKVERQKRVPVQYEELHFDEAFRLDLLVNDMVIVEVKSVDALTAVNIMQMRTYLRLMDLRLGLILNFGDTAMKYGIKRVANGL